MELNSDDDFKQREVPVSLTSIGMVGGGEEVNVSKDSLMLCKRPSSNLLETSIASPNYESKGRKLLGALMPVEGQESCDLDFINKVNFDRERYFRLHFQIEKPEQQLIEETLLHFEKKYDSNNDSSKIGKENKEPLTEGPNEVKMDSHREKRSGSKSFLRNKTNSCNEQRKTVTLMTNIDKRQTSDPYRFDRRDNSRSDSHKDSVTSYRDKCRQSTAKDAQVQCLCQEIVKKMNLLDISLTENVIQQVLDKMNSLKDKLEKIETRNAALLEENKCLKLKLETVSLKGDTNALTRKQSRVSFINELERQRPLLTSQKSALLLTQNLAPKSTRATIQKQRTEGPETGSYRFNKRERMHTDESAYCTVRNSALKRQAPMLEKRHSFFDKRTLKETAQVPCQKTKRQAAVLKTTVRTLVQTKPSVERNALSIRG